MSAWMASSFSPQLVQLSVVSFVFFERSGGISLVLLLQLSDVSFRFFEKSGCIVGDKPQLLQFRVSRFVKYSTPFML